jgi:hypothetical protein
MYDFLDAGLSGIMPKGSFSCRLLQRYGVGVEGTLEFFKNARPRLMKLLEAGVQDRVKKAQSSYSVYRHAGRLVQFYQKIAGCPKQRFYSFCKQRIKEIH